jgi:hypothetical protein
VYKKQVFNYEDVMYDMMPMPMARNEAAGAMAPMAAPAEAQNAIAPIQKRVPAR